MRLKMIHLLLIISDGNNGNTRSVQCTWVYRQTSNISRTWEGSKILDHSDVVGASPVGADYIFILDLTPDFDGLGKDNVRRDENLQNFGIWCF